MPPSENAALPAALLDSNAERRNDADGRCSTTGRWLRSGLGSYPPPYDPRRAGGDDDEAMWMPGYAGSSSMGVRGDADETEDADECESAGDMSA